MPWNEKNVITGFKYRQEELEKMGENIKLSTKRRKMTTIQVAESVAINQSKLAQIEKGNSRVTLGGYFNTFLVLGLHDDFFKPQTHDVYGRKLHLSKK